MKKLLPLIMTLFFALSLNAQVGVNVGPKIGYQASKLSFKKTDIKTSFNNDLNLGVFTRFTFKKFILQPELLYSFQNASHKVNNLSVPVLVGLKLVDQKNFKMRANVGPVAYFTVGNSNYSGLKKVNWGGALGLGVDIWRLTLDVNYSLGMTKIFGDLLGVNNNVKQNIFTVTLGFKLRY